MKHYILGMMVLLVPGPFLWAMEKDLWGISDCAMIVDNKPKQVSFSLTQTDDYGRSPLDGAIRDGNEEAAALLISKGVNVSEDCLCDAALSGKLSLVKFLVAWGANINAISRSSIYSVLMIAVLWGRADIVEFLLMQADLDICYRIFNKTALVLAYDLNKHAIARMISDKIDRIKKKILRLCSLCQPEGLSQQEQEEWLETLKAKIKRRILQIHTIDIVDENGDTPLHKAAISGNDDLAFWILSIQPSLIVRENKLILGKNKPKEVVSGYTPLHCDVDRWGMYAKFTRKCIEMC